MKRIVFNEGNVSGAIWERKFNVMDTEMTITSSSGEFIVKVPFKIAEKLIGKKVKLVFEIEED